MKHELFRLILIKPGQNICSQETKVIEFQQKVILNGKIFHRHWLRIASEGAVTSTFCNSRLKL